MKNLSPLFEVSQILDSGLDLGKVVEPVLQVIAGHFQAVYSSLTLLNRKTGEISIDAAYGLTAKQQRRGK